MYCNKMAKQHFIMLADLSSLIVKIEALPDIATEPTKHMQKLPFRSKIQT